MKLYDAWCERYSPRHKIRVVCRQKSYWLRRRSDLLTGAEQVPNVIDRQFCLMAETALDLLADATGQDELSLACCADFKDWLLANGWGVEFMLGQEAICNWVIRWFCDNSCLVEAISRDRGGKYVVS